MAHDKIHVRPLVPRYLHDFTKAIIDGLPNGDQFLPIHHAKVSLIFNPHDIKGLFPGARMGDFAFEGAIDLLLVSGNPERKPLAAFDIYRREEPRFLREKQYCFEEVGLLYFACDKTSWRNMLPKMIALFSDHSREGWGTSSIINPTQWNVMSRLADKAAELNLYLLHEVSLDSVIAVHSGAGVAGYSRTAIVLNQDYLRTTSFDAVIATAPPNCKPVCAIEFDGRIHEDPKKQRKDEKKNQACSEARLPLIRIPSVDVKAADVGRTVVDIREQVQIKRAEVSWLVVEELLRALADGHFSSTWYLSQLHHFLSLEADTIAELDPDSGDTLRDYASELWTLAEGRIRSLEEKTQRLTEQSENLYPWDQWLKEYHYTDYDLGQEELMRINDRVWEFQRRVGSGVDDCVLKGWSGLKLVDLHFSKTAVTGLRGAARYSLRLEGTELLGALGVSIKPWTIELGPIGISVSGDALGVTSKLIDEVAFGYLLRSAKDDIGIYKAKILHACQAGESVLWQYVAGDVWSRIPISSIESEIKRLLKNAVKNIECDFSNASEKQVKDFFDGKRDAIPVRDVSLEARLDRLTQVVRDCREALERSTISGQQKSSLAALIDRESVELRGSGGT